MSEPPTNLLPLVLLFTPLGAGCPKDPPEPRKSEGTECAERAGAIKRELTKLVEPHREDLTVDRRKLVKVHSAPFAPSLPTLVLTRASDGTLMLDLDSAGIGVTFQDGRWDPYFAGKLAAELTRKWADQRRRLPNRKLVKRVSLLVDPEVPWSVLADLLGRLAAHGVGRVGLLVEIPDPPPPMPPSKATAELAKMRAEYLAATDPANPALPIARQETLKKRARQHWERASAGCPQLAKIFEGVGPVPPTDKGRVLIQALYEALVACRCRADLPVVHASIYGMLHRRPVGVIWFVHQARGQAITRPAGETWRKTVEGWLRPERKIELRGRPAVAAAKKAAGG